MRQLVRPGAGLVYPARTCLEPGQLEALQGKMPAPIAEPPAPVSLNAYRRGLSASSFGSVVSFMTAVAILPLSWGEFDPDPILRGIMVMMHFGLVKSPQACAQCGGKIRFLQRKDAARGTYRYRWWCCKPQKTCSWNQGVNTYGFLTQLRLESWLPFMLIRGDDEFGLPG